MTQEGLKNRTVKNIGYNAVAKLIMFGFQTIANIILTRTLLPTDYGIVGMAAIFMNFFILFGNMGIVQAVIRKEHLSERELYTGFTVRVLQGLLMVFLCNLAAPIAGKVFSNPEVGTILSVYSLIFIINSFGFIPIVRLKRDLQYDRLFLPQVGYTMFGSTVAIILALTGFREWSLVFSTLSSTVAYVLLLNIMKPSKFRFCFDAAAAKSFFNFGMNIFWIGLVSYALLNSGNLLIGAISGSIMLGYFTIATSWGSMIYKIILTSVSSVLLPTFAKMQNDTNRLRNAYLKMIEFIGVVSFFVNLTLILTGKEFLYFILGHSSDKWYPALISMQILCLFGIMRSLLEPGLNLMMAIGNTSTPFRANLLAAAVQIILLYPALRFSGINGVAIAIVFATSTQFIVYLPAMKKSIDLSWSAIAEQLKPAFWAMLFTAIFVFLCTRVFILQNLSGFFLKLILISLTYLITYGFLTRWKIINEIRSILNVSKVKKMSEHG